MRRRHFTCALALGAATLRAETARAQLAPVKKAWPNALAAPALALPTLEGTPWALESARGKVVLLNFWASWCPPCVDEMPSLELLEQRHAAQGLAVMAVNFRENEATIRRFVERMAFSLPVLRDADGAAARRWQVGIFPTSIVIDRRGRILFSIVGEADWGANPARQWIAEVL